jgi:hypothetical protein
MKTQYWKWHCTNPYGDLGSIYKYTDNKNYELRTLAYMNAIILYKDHEIITKICLKNFDDLQKHLEQICLYNIDQTLLYMKIKSI